MPFNPMEGPVTIPMGGLSLECMYDSMGLRDSPLIAQVRGKEYTPLGASSTTYIHILFPISIPIYCVLY